MKRRNHYRALLALQLVPELGLRRIKLLLQKTGVENASDIFHLKLPDILRIDGIGRNVAQNILNFKNWGKVDEILKKTERTDADFLSIDDADYPELLRHIYDPPILLWIKGDKKALNLDGIAVIGTRRPGKYGVNQAGEWVNRLVENGMCINSGLAYGIDSVAHREALQAGGKTVAVLGSGIDVLYPAKNSFLVHRMIEKGGAVITEYPPGTAPDAVNFPERNRIVSGMSHGVLVIESGIKGGSMITARSALDQNREVFVVPHMLNYPGGEGCNYLIKSGQGKLIQTISDILDEISVQTGNQPEPSSEAAAKRWETMELDEESKRICKLLQGGEIHIDHISEKTGKPAYTLLSVLLDLEMKGAIKQKAGKYFELC